MTHSDHKTPANFASADLDALIQNAVASFAQQDYAQAEGFLLQAVELDSRAVEPRFHLANFYNFSGRIDEALQYLEPVKDATGVREEYDWLSFKQCWNQNDLERACVIARRIITNANLIPDRSKEIVYFAKLSGYLSLYGTMIERTGSFTEKRNLKWIVSACSMLKALPGVLWRNPVKRVTDRLQQRGRWRKVRVLLTAALIADPGNSTWIVRIARVYRITRDVYDPQFSRERACYESVLRNEPDDGPALDGLLLTLSDMKAWTELKRILERIPAENFNSWRRSIQAMCLANLGEYEEADRRYDALQHDDPDHARFCRGLIALEDGRMQQAAEFFQSNASEYKYKTLNRYFFEIAQQRISNSDNSDIDGQPILDSLNVDTPYQYEGPDFQDSRCALCGFTGERLPLWRDTRSGWVRVRCPQCSMISVAPIPSLEAILELYKQPKGEEKSLYLHAQKDVEALRNASESHCRELTEFRLLTQWDAGFSWNDFEGSLGNDKRFLDIGCSAGKTITLFQQCGWRASGMDVDPDAVSFARSVGLDARQGTLDTLGDWLATYHFITLVDVIEHLQDPAAFLKQIYDLIEPGGMFYVKTPCADSLPHRFLGDRWLESCEHLHFFSRNALIQMLQKAGFQIVGVKQTIDETTPYLHEMDWKHRFFPQLLEEWIAKTMCGDVVMVLARKSVYKLY